MSNIEEARAALMTALERLDEVMSQLNEAGTIAVDVQANVYEAVAGTSKPELDEVLGALGMLKERIDETVTIASNAKGTGEMLAMSL